MRLLLFFFLFPSVLIAQSKIYKGDRPNQNDIIYQISSQKITRMTSSIWGKDVLFIRNNSVYDNTYLLNCRYTLVGNKIYRGESTSVFDLIYEIENGKVYLVSNSSLKKCIYTFRNNQIYVGDSTSVFDCIFSYDIDTKVDNNEILIFLAIAPF